MQWWLILIGAGVVLWVADVFLKQKRGWQVTSGSAPKGRGDTVNDEEAGLRAQMRGLKNQYPEMPEVPVQLTKTEYDGWFAEAKKAMELKAYQRTQAERIAALKQIDEMQKIGLSIMRTGADLHYHKKETKIREKRLDIEEMQLDDQINEIGKKRNTPPPPPPPPREPKLSKPERIRKMKQQKEADHMEYADDPELQAKSDRYWDDKIDKVFLQDD